MPITSPVTVNGRTYAAPKTCAVAICLDGCEPAYLEAAIARGLMPNLERIRANGTKRIAHSVIPSFTNPNNMSIATGRPPAIHGICGNYLYEPETGEEVMMNDVRFLRAPTIFSHYYAAGARVALVTAKDKLRALLGTGLSFDEDRAICFSSQCADQATKAEHGIENASTWLGRPVPEVYSAELSEFVFAAGVKILEEWNPDVLYLSTTDYIQHKFAPDEDGALRFNAMVDGLEERERIRNLFGKYVPESVAQLLLQDDGAGRPQSANATVFFLDLAGFSTMSEKLDPAGIVATMSVLVLSKLMVVKSQG